MKIRPFLLVPAWLLAATAALAQLPALTLESLPRPGTPPPEKGPVVPAQVERWREEARRHEHGDGYPRDAVRAAELYCRAARYGDAEAQYSLAWMLVNERGIERNDATAAHLFAAAAEQGHAQAANIAARMGTPQGDQPPCLRIPEPEQAPPPPITRAATLTAGRALPAPPLPAHAPPLIVNYVRLLAPEYKVEPWLVLAVMAAESNFDPLALSPKKASGLMQLIPDTAARFGVRNLTDPAQNIRGGMAYLRWLLAYFEGDVMLTLAAYNAGEGAVERWRGIPPYAETRHYVRKIMASTGHRLSHAFDARVVAPSMLALRIREQLKIR
jgi:soluble lytic murein transglycosylase-like protein